MISVLIPVFNEVKFIHKLIDSLLMALPQPSEVFLMDGNSTDGTVEVIKEYELKDPRIKLIHNEKKYVSFGFNKTFPVSKGEYLCLLGAHAEYPIDFFSTGIKYLESNECDIVGGPLIQKGHTENGKTIAYCMSSKFGVGDTEFRTESKKMFVDSVAFAIYKREVFEKAGLLNEKLIRNQDDELHYRLNAYGFKILMVPEMACSYYVRESIPKLFSQYFQYGIYKPLVLKLVKSSVRLRHLIPAFFVLYILSLPLAIIFPIYFLPLLFYLFLDLYFSFKNTLSLSQKLFALAVFPSLHFSYGMGFIIGLFKK